jgi:hypothetical protein
VYVGKWVATFLEEPTASVFRVEDSNLRRTSSVNHTPYQTEGSSKVMMVLVSRMEDNIKTGLRG